MLNLRRAPPSLFEYEIGDVEVVGYQHHPPGIKAPHRGLSPRAFPSRCGGVVAVIRDIQ